MIRAFFEKNPKRSSKEINEYNEYFSHIVLQLNNVHAIREHPAEPHVAHFEKSVPEVDFRDAKVQDINLGGVQTPEARSKNT